MKHLRRRFSRERWGLKSKDRRPCRKKTEIDEERRNGRRTKASGIIPRSMAHEYEQRYFHGTSCAIRVEVSQHLS